MRNEISKWYNEYLLIEKEELKKLPMKQLIAMHEGLELNENRASTPIEMNYQIDSLVDLILMVRELQVIVNDISRNGTNALNLSKFWKCYDFEKNKYLDNGLNIDHFNLGRCN